jgi:hypothetical protein
MTEQTAAGASTRLEDLRAGLRLSGLLPQTVSILTSRSSRLISVQSSHSSYRPSVRTADPGGIWGTEPR